MELKVVPIDQKYSQVSKMSKKLKIGPKFITFSENLTFGRDLLPRDPEGVLIWFPKVVQVEFYPFFFTCGV